MIIHTFEKWNLLGFDIIKGSKAITFIEGLPYFNESQVKKKLKNINLTIKMKLLIIQKFIMMKIQCQEQWKVKQIFMKEK